MRSLGTCCPRVYPRLVTRVLSLTRGRERTLGMRLQFHFPAEVEVKKKKEKDVKILNFNMLRNILRLITAVDPSSFFFHSIFKGYPSALQTKATLSPMSATSLDSLIGNRTRTVDQKDMSSWTGIFLSVTLRLMYFMFAIKYFVTFILVESRSILGDSCIYRTGIFVSPVLVSYSMSVPWGPPPNVQHSS